MILQRLLTRIAGTIGRFWKASIVVEDVLVLDFLVRLTEEGSLRLRASSRRPRHRAFFVSLAAQA